MAKQQAPSSIRAAPREADLRKAAFEKTPRSAPTVSAASLEEVEPTRCGTGLTGCVPTAGRRPGRARLTGSAEIRTFGKADIPPRMSPA